MSSVDEEMLRIYDSAIAEAGTRGLQSDVAAKERRERQIQAFKNAYETRFYSLAPIPPPAFILTGFDIGTEDRVVVAPPKPRCAVCMLEGTFPDRVFGKRQTHVRKCDACYLKGERELVKHMPPAPPHPPRVVGARYPERRYGFAATEVQLRGPR
jgi:hypothetical protein